MTNFQLIVMSGLLGLTVASVVTLPVVILFCFGKLIAELKKHRK